MLGRLLRPGPGAVRGLLRPDADPVLLPLGDLGRSGPGASDDPAGHLHAGRLVLHARRRHRHRRAGLQPARHAADLRAQLAAAACRSRTPRRRGCSCAFAVAFLVKMPLVPFHGWLPDGYKAMPIPAVAVFSAILSKVAAYGFLRIVLPLFPYAAVHFQTLMLIIALVSIIWATLVAMTTPDARLVVAYSSVAQLGFIVLGIFSLRPEGAQGALLQMVNHALVTAPLFFIVAALAGARRRLGEARRHGRDRLPRAGPGRPVPHRHARVAGHARLVELHRGVHDPAGRVQRQAADRRSIASLGVVGAAAYALRAFIRAMHNRVGPRVNSFDISDRRRAARSSGWSRSSWCWPSIPSSGCGAPSPTVRAAVAPAQAQQIAQASVERPQGGPGAMSTLILAAAQLKGPHIDWASFMPFVILGVRRAGGAARSACSARWRARRWCRWSRSRHSSPRSSSRSPA